MATLHPACRKVLHALAASAFAVSAAFAATPDAAAKPAHGQSVPLKADRDGDKVFDDLETRLPALVSGERVSVIILLEDPATGARVRGSAGSGTTADITAAIDWVVQNKDSYGIEAINLSLGATGCGDGTDAASQAVNNAHLAGLVVAVAAGNEGPGTCTVGAPAAAANAITVAAMADLVEGGFRQAWFSSRGPTADGRVKPDVSAPGSAVPSAQANTVSGYAAQSGTSMATPFVAGVALLMRDANPALTPQQVKDVLVMTAVDGGRGGDNRTASSIGPDIDYGAGRLDAYAALAAAGAPLAAPPVVPSHKLVEGSLSGTGAVADYKLDVTNAAYPIAATLIISSLSAGSATSPDFDLYLYDPAGTLVARAETYDRQEAITYRPKATGTYTLRARTPAAEASS